MAKNKRLDNYRSLLNNLLSKEDFVILTNPKTENYIQFAWESNNKLLVDIPTQDLESIHPSESLINSRIANLENSGFDSLQKVCKITEAINIIEIFFKDICNLPDNYNIKILLYTDCVETTTFIGDNIKNKIDFLVCDIVQKHISIVNAKNIKKAKKKYSLNHIDIDGSLKFDIEIKNDESQFWEEFIYEINNKNELLKNLQNTFGLEESEELFDYFHNEELKFDDLSNKTKKEIALRDINNAIQEGTLLIKPYFQIKKIL